MFYNNRGMILFMSAYLGALFYSAARISDFAARETQGVFLFLFWLLFGLTLPLGLFQEKYDLQLRRMGGVALAFVLHLSVAFLFLDLWRLSVRWGVPFSPPSAMSVVNAALLWIAYGVARAQRITVRRLDFKLHPDRELDTPLSIVAVADIHAGGVVEQRYLNRLQKCIERCRPDLLLFLGDLSDGDVDCARRVGLAETLASLEAPLGKFAVLGNHDIYAGAENSLALLREAGVTVLQDEHVVVDDSFVLLGRNDPRGRHFGIARSALAEILPGRPDLPLVVIDHTPCRLDEAAESRVALQLSGHTHGGQVFPFNWMMRRVYGIASGVMKKGDTAFCVSSGAGLWTMPLRTVTDSEIVHVRFF